MADLKLAVAIIENQINETLDNIIFDIKAAQDESNYDEVRRLLDKTITRIGHCKLALDAHLNLGQIALP
jgi:hypothetical protein